MTFYRPLSYWRSVQHSLLSARMRVIPMGSGQGCFIFIFKEF